MKYKATMVQTSTPAERRDERLNSFAGELMFPPEIGTGMIFMNVDGPKGIRTSPVRSITSKGSDLIVETKNTTYRLEPLIEKEPEAQP